ncbi:IclR family transcriptional regulator [Sphingomonas sp. G-3-2-10]|uniref:IclR family transcriptional regulator n=1 Tax=Sphingomonas sp. G-3-2-10 TaxID=2728838 RepID=UPI00146F54E0|nr:IclR family transcriptional regulator [Sphingomonas sp. G-3-2-10]NML06676.1 IclR family transcriptional regulator [Sphingomonas sp. G-3-2-10]
MASNTDLPDATETGAAKVQGGSQTLLRGLDVIESVADGPISLADLAARLDLTRSTTHRLATALVERRYLTFVPRLGYQFGPKLLELGFLAQQQTDIVQLARPHLEELAAATEDTVHLGVLDNERALYLDKIPGRRRIDISSRVGDRHPLTATGLGKSLLLDDDAGHWRKLFDEDRASGAPPADYGIWLERMHGYVKAGRSFDLEENEDRIRCVAAPIRDFSGNIVAALSVSSAAQYMSDERMAALTTDVMATAGAISSDMGWSADTPRRRPRR